MFFLTQPFKVLRSIRQGCPLSSQLCSLVAEPLGLLINKEKGIKRIEMEEGGELKKIFQYADDTTCDGFSGCRTKNEKHEDEDCKEISG